MPYKGTGQAVTDLLAGHVDLMFAPAQTVMPYVREGRLKALAHHRLEALETLPDLPTVAESGLPGLRGGRLVRPARARSDAAGDRGEDSADANRVLAEREVREKMLGLGADPSGDTPEEFARFIRDDQAKWSKLMKEAGIAAPQ